MAARRTSTMQICTFSCDVLSQEDLLYIAGTLDMGDFEKKVYLKYMEYWKGGRECDNAYATTIAIRIKDAIRNGYYARFDAHWSTILYNIIQNELVNVNPVKAQV